MKTLNYLILLLLLIGSCKKDSPRFKDEESSDITTYVIDLEGGTIASYSVYLNSTLESSVYFTDMDSIVEKLTKKGTGELIQKEVFRIGGQGYAVSSTDSTFKDSALYYTNYTVYEYSDGFLTKATINYHYAESPGDSSTIVVTYSIASNNISTINSPYGCSNYYQFNEDVNIIDVRSFSNGILGKISQNLVSHASWNNNCPTGPSMSVAKSDYEYELSESNYITMMRETYTPSYHSETDVVTRTIRTTYYVYQ
jgi:hypothetical protein